MDCKYTLPLFTALLLVVSNVCHANLSTKEFLENVRPFIGVDAAERSMGFDKAYGSNIFKKQLPQYDIYAGIRLFQYFGVSVGYEKSGHKNRTARLQDGDTILGLVIAPGEGPESHYTETQIKGRHIDLMGFYPLVPSMDVEIFGSVGLVRNHLMLQDILITIDDVPLIDPIIRTYDVKKTVPRLTVGLQKIFCKHFGLRGMIAWEETSQFFHLKPLEVPDAATNVNPRDSFIYSIGLFVTA